VQSKLVGRPNVYNLLAAVATASALDVPVRAIEEGLAALPGVPGRFQVVSSPEDDVAVVVDYAHTDDALKNLLETARALSQGRMLTVFGCGGDRDRTKRPLMGAVAGRLSDVVVITSDNPRSEDPARIIEEVERGIPGAADRAAAGRSGARSTPVKRPEVLSIVDRGEAIARAVEMARSGDLVLVAGKGHEKTQVIGDRELPFDDVDVSRAALARRRARQRVG
jgi:UDP-N-acetylmuramoyl-L-alanyl-D-glutamate--2,6-diaminopimelate ligase